MANEIEEHEYIDLMLNWLDACNVVFKYFQLMHTELFDMKFDFI